MELHVFWRTLRRRWYLTLVVLALTVGATAYAVRTVGPTYKAEGSALVFPPASSTRSEGETKTVGNPYLELAGVSQARDVVIRSLTSRNVSTDWEEQFPGMTYEVTPDFTNSAPIILFVVEGGTATGAAAALDDLMGRVPSILVDLQDGLGLPQDGFVTARKLTQDSRPAVVHKDQIRAALLVAAMTAGLGLLLLALADSLLNLRVRRRSERSERSDETTDETADTDDRGDERPGDAHGPPMVEREPAGDPEEEPEVAYTYRVPLESDLAVSPARSRWSRRSLGSESSGLHAPLGGREVLFTTSRTKASSRNR
ncbi:hypothetical protein SAMN04489844_0543 [Nocardioides exalbidus]|uniref:Capsular polysaccharide biosynthesis protein n=1 Tax=Nocardioides exalbidus TaxID=402596 RepID=A0A1H4KEP3_9ACTN|nr:hypothetical protein [Nocardioides exalbidus]SEB56585.1 hypothetical protein SAMN04489844_0543 [Nocardioides exalbidus]